MSLTIFYLKPTFYGFVLFSSIFFISTEGLPLVFLVRNLMVMNSPSFCNSGKVSLSSSPSPPLILLLFPFFLHFEGQFFSFSTLNILSHSLLVLLLLLSKFCLSLIFWQFVYNMSQCNLLWIHPFWCLLASWTWISILPYQIWEVSGY